MSKEHTTEHLRAELKSLSDTLEEVLSSSGEKSKEELSKIRSKAEQALKQSRYRLGETGDAIAKQTRVAAARAIAGNPSLILADEPTGALDSVTGRKIMDLFHKLHKEQGITIVLITHSNELAEETQRIITLKDGEIIGERKGSISCC